MKRRHCRTLNRVTFTTVQRQTSERGEPKNVTSREPPRDHPTLSCEGDLPFMEITHIYPRIEHIVSLGVVLVHDCGSALACSFQVLDTFSFQLESGDVFREPHCPRLFVSRHFLLQLHFLWFSDANSHRLQSSRKQSTQWIPFLLDQGA